MGGIIELRDEENMEQHSYCYLARATKKVSGPMFTDLEIRQGFELEWIRMDNALEVFDNDEPDNIVGRYINLRDSIFLKKGIELIMDGLSSQKKY